MRSLVPATLVRPSVVETIRKHYPEWDDDGYICLTDLTHYRVQHVQDLLATDRGEISTLEQDVLDSMREHEVLARDTDAEFDQHLTLGQRLADRIADFGGSWRFILLFVFVLTVWIVINAVAFFGKRFDPYPFILLNLILSTLAAIQAPVIMMSQNRQEDRDRARSVNDYRVNLKAELEIRVLREMLDHLLAQQWGRLLEIQQVQLDMMEHLGGHPRRHSASEGSSPAEGTSGADPTTP